MSGVLQKREKHYACYPSFSENISIINVFGYSEHSWTVSALHQQLGSWIFAAVKDTSKTNKNMQNK